ncbi:uncharacterized protein A4U43_C01F17390 [Asparagus officinalis]|uniref:Uncharacterized protein n=1 Tax=Asparagus officinalis TaxID=4686 RepID=A0A5P1FRU5_ASPOF|nr:uncharacterized protein A4U43_C01F17390 [Asparagus officinalis]
MDIEPDSSVDPAKGGSTNFAPFDEDVFDFISHKNSIIFKEKPNDQTPEYSYLSSEARKDQYLDQNRAWVRVQAQRIQTEENQGLELVSLLTSCAESITSNNYAAVNYILSRLGELASPRGTPIQRLSAYLTEALALRSARVWPDLFSISPPREIVDQINDYNDGIALRLLDQVCPIPKFLHFTLNERLARAFEGQDKIHIIDFSISEGLQWPSFFQTLASRPHPPTHLRITGIGNSRQDLEDTGARLKALAESLNIQFEFHPVIDKLEDVRYWMLHVKESYSIAVSCVLQLHKVLYDENRRALANLLGLIRSTRPSMLLVAEEEEDHNSPRWETRLANSMKYYSAIFDALNSCFRGEDSLARMKIEEMFGSKVRNIIACESVERIERHEKFDVWKGMMEGCGFRCIGFEEREAIRAEMILKMYSNNGDQGFGMEKRGEEFCDALTLNWNNQALYTVSAWEPVSDLHGL